MGSKSCGDCKFLKQEFKVGKVKRSCSYYGSNESSHICGDFKVITSELEDEEEIENEKKRPLSLSKSTKMNNNYMEKHLEEFTEVSENYDEQILIDSMYETVHHIFKVQKVNDKVLEDIEDQLIKQGIDIPIDTKPIKKATVKMTELYLIYQNALTFGFVGDHMQMIMQASIDRIFGPVPSNETTLKIKSGSNESMTRKRSKLI